MNLSNGNSSARASNDGLKALHMPHQEASMRTTTYILKNRLNRDEKKGLIAICEKFLSMVELFAASARVWTCNISL
jgi:hypothetical protein